MPENKKAEYCCCIVDSETEDHRKIGQRLEIFDFDPLIGAGMPYWLENGHAIKEIVKRYINSVQCKYGVKMVTTPELGRKELYETSGHWDHYKENMFPVLKLDENDDYILRPMTCPHHILLYKKNRWHENHLPVSFGENAKLYRYECSGGLFGLERTRCMELIDTHMFCTQETINDCLGQVLNIIQEVKNAFDIEYDSVVLSIRDKNKEKFYDDDELWDNAEQALKAFMENNKVDFQLGVGDAAFYGPKIDFQIKTHSGKIITISTIQLDFLLPKKFNLSYFKGSKGEKGVPIMIHLGIIGTLERFIAYLLERDNGWLPFWVCPVQVSIIPVDPKKHLEVSQQLMDLFNNLNIRTEIVADNETLSKRLAQVINRRVYGHVVVGDKEVERIDLLLNTAEGGFGSDLKKIIALIKLSKGKRESMSVLEYFNARF